MDQLEDENELVLRPKKIEENKNSHLKKESIKNCSDENERTDKDDENS